MKTALRMILAVALLATTAFPTLAETPFPPFIQQAQGLIAQAAAKARELNDFSDAVLIGQNYLRNAEAEFRDNLSWGKLDQKAEPTVRYYASMAELQAKVVLSRAEKVAQERERVRIEAETAAVRAKIKVFDDRVAQIADLKGELAKRDASLAELKARLAEQKANIEQLEAKAARLSADLTAGAAALNAAESRGGDASRELAAKQAALTALEKKNEELARALALSQGENRKLRDEMAVLAAQKGAVESQSKEQIEALNRQREFVAEVGQLGGVIKSGSDNMTVIFARSAMLKAPRNDTLSAEGDRTVARIVELMTKYAEFRAKVKVHGFGQPAKNEDAAATDRVARLIREALLVKGKFEPTAVEALGAGAAEPIYPKSNPEGNRRVEITFVRK